MIGWLRMPKKGCNTFERFNLLQRDLTHFADASKASIQVSRVADKCVLSSSLASDETASKASSKPDTAGLRAATRSALAPGAPIRACEQHSWYRSNSIKVR